MNATNHTLCRHITVLPEWNAKLLMWKPSWRVPCILLAWWGTCRCIHTYSTYTWGVLSRSPAWPAGPLSADASPVSVYSPCSNEPSSPGLSGVNAPVLHEFVVWAEEQTEKKRTFWKANECGKILFEVFKPTLYDCVTSPGLHSW